MRRKIAAVATLVTGLLFVTAAQAQAVTPDVYIMF